jgi:hypothetical protein
VILDTEISPGGSLTCCGRATAKTDQVTASVLATQIARNLPLTARLGQGRVAVTGVFTGRPAMGQGLCGGLARC